MASETASSADEEGVANASIPTVTEKRGKHRILAELKRLEQDSKFLEVLSVFHHLLSFFLAFSPIFSKSQAPFVPHFSWFILQCHNFGGNEVGSWW